MTDYEKISETVSTPRRNADTVSGQSSTTSRDACSSNAPRVTSAGAASTMAMEAQRPRSLSGGGRGLPRSD